MAGNNQFYPVATGAGANVLTAASWGASPVRQSGFQSGIAPSSGFNTAWRQSSVVASMIGQFIASAGYDALDNGDLTTLLVNFQNAISQLALGSAPSGISLVHSGPDTSSIANQIIISTVTPAVTALQDYQIYEIRPANDVTGNATVKISSLNPVPLYRQDGVQIAVGDAKRNQSFLAVYIGGSMYRIGISPSEISNQSVTNLANQGARQSFRAQPTIPDIQYDPNNGYQTTYAGTDLGTFTIPAGYVSVQMNASCYVTGGTGSDTEILIGLWTNANDGTGWVFRESNRVYKFAGKSTIIARTALVTLDPSKSYTCSALLTKNVQTGDATPASGNHLGQAFKF